MLCPIERARRLFTAIAFTSAVAHCTRHTATAPVATDAAHDVLRASVTTTPSDTASADRRARVGMRHVATTPPSDAAVIAVTRDAGASPSSDCLQPAAYVRAGVFATRDAALAAGAVLAIERDGGIEQDGSPAQLLVVHATDGDLDGRPALVYAHRAVTGWTARCVEAGDDRNHYAWSVPLSVAGHVVFVVANRFRWGEGEDETSGIDYDLFVLRPDGVVARLAVASALPDQPLSGTDARTFAAAPDGTLVTTDARGVASIVRIDSARGAIVAVAPGSVPATVPPIAMRLAPQPAAPACFAMPANAFHLRATDVAASSGPEYPSATRLLVLQAGLAQRGAARSYACAS